MFYYFLTECKYNIPIRQIQLASMQQVGFVDS